MEFHNLSKTITEELGRTLLAIDEDVALEFVNQLKDKPAIFVGGAGRSGFMARGFAMRLMHMGYRSYLVGETTTPAISKDDLLVICSGSGETKSLVSMASKAKALGAKVALITINPESTIGHGADTIVKIPAPSPKATANSDFVSIQPMGNLFEQSLLLFLDMSIMLLMNQTNKTSEEMFKLHANLE
jgi:6-phospho-3-hexuloisomerase